MDKPFCAPASAPLLNSLCGRLREALRYRDWSAVTRTDAEIAALLAAYDAPAGPAEQRAWTQLRQTHQQAFDECMREVSRLNRTLEQMRDNRQGWQAYVESQGWSAPASVKEWTR